MEEVTKRFIDVYDFLIKNKIILNSSDFAKKLGVSNSMITEILKGRTGVGTKLLFYLIKDFKVNGGWLFSGNGSMFIEDKDDFSLSQVSLNMLAEGKFKKDEIVLGKENNIDNVFLNDDEDNILYNDQDNIEVFTNTNENKFYVYPTGIIKIEVRKVPFPAYASYIESFNDESKCLDNFDTITFMVDHIAKGNYLGFISEGESMNGGMLYDTPGGSEILAREIGRQFWDNLHSTKYGLVFVTKTGIMHKDIGGYNKETGMFTLLSRNKEHKPFEYPANDVYQIFNVIKRSF